jgi:hypothetical protein
MQENAGGDELQRKKQSACDLHRLLIAAMNANGDCR